MEKYIDAMMQKIKTGDFVPTVELKELLQNHIQNQQIDSSIWSKRRKSTGIELAKKLLDILTEVEQCDLIFLQQEPNTQEISNLPITCQKAYACINEKFYLIDKQKNECTLLEKFSCKNKKSFIEELKKYSGNATVRRLSARELMIFSSEIGDPLCIDPIASVIAYLNVNHDKIEANSELAQLLSAFFSICINQLCHIHDGLLNKLDLQDVWQKRCSTLIDDFIHQVKHATDMESTDRALHCLSQIKTHVSINKRTEIIERLIQLMSSNIKQEYLLAALRSGNFKDWIPESYVPIFITGLTKARNELLETCYDDSDVIPINKLHSHQFNLEKKSLPSETIDAILSLMQLERLNPSEFRALLNHSILASGMIGNINPQAKIAFTKNLIKFLKNNNDELIDLAAALLYNLPHWVSEDQKENVADALISHLNHKQVHVRVAIYNVLPTIKEWMPVTQREEVVKSVPLSFDGEPEYYAALDAFISYVDYLNPSLKFILLSQMSDSFWQGKLAFIHLYDSYKKDIATDILQSIKSETNKTLPLEMAIEIVNRI